VAGIDVPKMTTSSGEATSMPSSPEWFAITPTTDRSVPTGSAGGSKTVTSESAPVPSSPYARRPESSRPNGVVRTARTATIVPRAATRASAIEIMGGVVTAVAVAMGGLSVTAGSDVGASDSVASVGIALGSGDSAASMLEVAAADASSVAAGVGSAVGSSLAAGAAVGVASGGGVMSSGVHGGVGSGVKVG
jgi:hypothetical protein